MNACGEIPPPTESVERWVALLLAASRYLLRRRLINGRIFVQQARITPDFWRKKAIGDLQLRCEHKSTMTSVLFLHCRKCDMRLQFLTVAERNQAQAMRASNESRKKSGSTGWSEWIQHGPKKPAEPELNTEGRSPTRTSARGSASSSLSNLEQALIAMMKSQQEGAQILSSQLQYMAKQQADSATTLSRAVGSLQQSMAAGVSVAESSDRQPRKKPATKPEIAQEFHICSENEMES